MTKNNIKQIVFMIMLCVVAVFASVNVSEAADCFHTYAAATCTKAKTCTKCGKTSGYPLGHNYEVNGNVATCTECGTSQKIDNGEEEESHVHTWIAATCTEAKKCKTCGETSGYALGHNFLTIISKEDATCGKAGKTVIKCTRCSKTQTTTTEALGHDYKTSTVNATCTTDGKTTKTCSRCGDTSSTTIKPTGHNYTVSTTTATCTVPGKTVKQCKVCGHTETTNGQALGHDYKTSTVNPTCTTSGKTTKTCSRCGDTSSTTIKPTGHDYTISTTTATCTVPGKTVKQCKVCGHTETTSGQALGHDDSIVFNVNYHWYECDRCNLQLSDKEYHKFEDNECVICGYHYNDEDSDDDEDNDEHDGELIVEPWMKENDELDCLAVSLRSEPYEEDRANKNIYALDEKVIYYVDYKNGGRDTDKEVTLKLTLPLSFSVVDSDGAKVSKSKKTLTWTFDGMENDESGTKVVIIKYTSLGKSSLTYKKVAPKATIDLGKTEKDVSAVLNLVVKDFDLEIDGEHDPYMFGDEDTGMFRPDDTITRGEGALVLTRIFGISTRYDSNTYAFPDLNETYLEARRAVIAATAAGIIEGYPDGTYKPRKEMTRAEFITILARQIEEEYGEGFEAKDTDSLIKVYKDKTKIYYISDTEYYDSHWAIAYATLLARLNMTSLSESERNLRLDKPITRAEVAQLVNFYLLRAPANVTSSTKSGFPDVSKRHDLFADIVEATRDSHEYSITDEGYEEEE